MKYNIQINQFEPGSTDLYTYLLDYRILDFYDIENLNDLKTLTKDYNLFSNSNLTIDEFYSNVKIIQNVLSLPKFSFFKKPIQNIFPYQEIYLEQLYEIIKNPKYYGKVTNQLRNIEDKNEARKFKSFNFDFVTVSGIFSKRKTDGLIKHSNLMVLDFDNIYNINETKRLLVYGTQIETQMCFVSPSGNGLKWIVAVDTKLHSQEIFFKGFQNYLKKNFNLEIDPSGKDVSRACFVCHDPEVFINPKYLK
jgi:hypothetical protein